MEPKYLVKFFESFFRDQLGVSFDGFVSIHFELSFEFWVFELLVDPCCRSFGFCHSIMAFAPGWHFGKLASMLCELISDVCYPHMLMEANLLVKFEFHQF